MESLSDIAVFVRVVDSGSFTSAAERLNLSKSVVSKYVSRLESQLGARLLNRTTRRLSLTEAGQVFYERTRKGLEDIEDAKQEVSRLQDEPRGTLRINVPMSFGILHVAPVLPDFIERYPEISVDVNFDDRKIDVIREGFDVSIRISDLPDSSLIAKRLGPCHHAIIAAPSYVEEFGEPKSPSELRHHRIINYRYQESASEWHFRGDKGQTESVPVSSFASMNNSLAIRSAALAGLGIARTPTFVVGNDLKEGRLIHLLPEFPTLEVTIYLVYPHRHYLSPKVRAFSEFLVEKIGDAPAWDQF